MYASAFSYSLTRPYPYPWFTWAVVLGGIVATALFSVLNVAAYGYDTSIIYVTNPNETEHPNSPAWYQKKPWSLASKVSTLCQSTTFEIGSRFYTNNTNLMYEIVSIQAGGQNQTSDNRGSFAYHNNPFRDCSVTEIELTMGAGRFSVERTIVDASVDVDCTIHVANTPTVVSLVFSLKDMKTYPFNVETTNRTLSAIWWATNLMEINGTFISPYMGVDPSTRTIYGYSTIGASMVNDQNVTLSCIWVEQISLTEKSGLTGYMEFDIPCDQPSVLQSIEAEPPATGDWAFSTASFDISLSEAMMGKNFSSNATDPTMYTLAKMDSMLKLFYGYVMTDLGQSDRSIFANGSALINFLNTTRPYWKAWPFYQNDLKGNTTNPGDGVGRVPNPIWSDGASLLPINVTTLLEYPWNSSSPETVEKFFESMGTPVPRVDPAVINAQYLCQVPKMKPIGSLIISVVVADLVLLQALWVAFNWVVRFIMERRDSEANYCLACGKATLDSEPLQKTTSEYSAMSSQLEMRDLKPVATQPAMRRRPVGGLPHPQAKTEPEISVRLLSET